MAEKKPIISVVMTVFNEPRSFLSLALNSILEQTFADFEMIVIDDGSTNEETLATLEEYRDGDSRVQLHQHDNCGQTPSLNLGLHRARGDFICRHDSDDWSEPQRFSKQLGFLEKHPQIGLVGSNVSRFTAKGEFLWNSSFPIEPEELLYSFKRMNPLCHGSVCLRRACAEAVGGYREDFLYAQDYDFFWRIVERFGGANLAEPYYNYRFHSRSISAENALGQVREVGIIRELAQMRKRSTPESIDKAKQEVDVASQSQDEEYLSYLLSGDFFLLAGNYRSSFFSYLKALGRRPFGLMLQARLLRHLLFATIPALRKQLFEPSIALPEWLRNRLSWM